MAVVGLTLFLGLLAFIGIVIVRVQVASRGDETKLLRSKSEPIYQGY